MPTIPGLPSAFPLPDGGVFDLRRVPEAPSDPLDPERGEKRRQWALWAGHLRRFRVERTSACAADPAQQAVEREKCRRFGPKYFLAVWGWLDDPRIDPITHRPRGQAPWLPYGFQVEFLDWLDQRLTETGSQADGAVSKTRDVGITWHACGWTLYHWMFTPAFQAKFISFKEDRVDRRNDPDSAFWKIDYLLDRLPKWLKPPGYNAEKHRFSLLFVNPENQNVISGESTTTRSLRGGRGTVAIYDEFSLFENGLGVWATGANAAGVRIAIATENMEKGDHFQRLQAGDGVVKPALFTVDHWQHPGRTDAWYTEMKERFASDPEAFAREVERNPYAGAGSWVYEIARTIEPGYFPYEHGQPLYVGIDPGFDDECALVFLAWDPVTGRYRIVEAFADRLKPPEYYASLLCGIPHSEFDYSATGPYDPELVMLLTKRATGFFVFGDPAGTNRVTGERDSWYDRMNLWAQQHAQRSLAVVVSWDRDKRTYTGRRASLQRLLPRIDVHDTPGARAVLRALKDHRFEKLAKDRLAEQVKPLHNANSHPVSALEYLAVNLEEMTHAAVPGPGVMDAA